VKPYLRKFHEEYMSSDIKPSGKMSRAIEGSVRSKTKQDIKKEVKNLPDEDDNGEELSLGEEIMLIQRRVLDRHIELTIDQMEEVLTKPFEPSQRAVENLKEFHKRLKNPQNCDGTGN
jgi:hypothetical protein